MSPGSDGLRKTLTGPPSIAPALVLGQGGAAIVPGTEGEIELRATLVAALLQGPEVMEGRRCVGADHEDLGRSSRQLVKGEGAGAQLRIPASGDGGIHARG